MSTMKNDPAAILGIAMSLHNGFEKIEGADLSSHFNGCDQFMRECMKAADTFESWACANVDFDKMEDVWPYLMQDKFCEAYLKSFHWSDLADFSEHHCLIVAGNLNLATLQPTSCSLHENT